MREVELRNVETVRDGNIQRWRQDDTHEETRMEIRMLSSCAMTGERPWGNATVAQCCAPHSPQAQLLSRECGQHLVEADDLLQKHGLLEGDIAAQSERVEALNAAALRFSQLQGESGVWGWGRVSQDWC